MWHPQCYLRPGSGSLAGFSQPDGFAGLNISRSEGLVTSPPGSAFSPLPGSAVFTGPITDFSSTLLHPATLATGFPACLGSPDDAVTNRVAGAIRYHALRSLGYHYSLTVPGYRNNVTRDATAVLKCWLEEHKKNPYPTRGEKVMLAIITKMTLTQVSTWFANARRRLKKENKMTSVGQPRSDNANEEEDCNDRVKNSDCLGKWMDSSENPAEAEGFNLRVETHRGSFSSPQTDGASVNFRARDTICNKEVDAPEEWLSPDPVTSSVMTSMVPALNHIRRDLNDSSISQSGARLDSNIAWGAQAQAPKPKLWSLAEIATSDPKDHRDQKGPARILSSTSLVTPTASSIYCASSEQSLFNLSHLSVL